VATDLDGDLVTFGFIPGAPIPAAMQMTQAGYMTWTPTSTGQFQIGIQISDGRDVTKYYFNITVVSPPPNQRPKVSPIPDVVLKEKNPIIIDLNDYVNDDGPLSEITWSLNGGDYNLFSAELNGTNLTLEVNKGANGRTRVTAVAKDGHGASGEYSFNITVKSEKPNEPTLKDSLKALWPLFLILIIIIIVAVLIATRRSSPASRRRKKRVRPAKIESWDQMKGDLYAEKRKEDLEEGPRFRGAVGAYSEDELLAEEELDTVEDGYAAPTSPEVEASYETVYASPGAQPVFATSIASSHDEEEVLEPLPDDEIIEPEADEGPETPTWTPAAALEVAEISEDEEAEGVQREQDLDDIMRRLRTEEETAYEEKKAAEIEAELEKEPLVTETEPPMPEESEPTVEEHVERPEPELPEALSDINGPEIGGPTLGTDAVAKEEPPTPEVKEEPVPEAKEEPKVEEKPSEEPKPEVEKKRPNLDDILKKLKM